MSGVGVSSSVVKSVDELVVEVVIEVEVVVVTDDAFNDDVISGCGPGFALSRPGLFSFALFGLDLVSLSHCSYLLPLRHW